MAEIEILMGGVWALVANSAEKEPTECGGLELLAPDEGGQGKRHRSTLVFHTEDVIAPSDALGAELVISPEGAGLGVLNLDHQLVTMEVDGDVGQRRPAWSLYRGARDVSKKFGDDNGVDWDAESVDYLAEGRRMGVEQIVVADPADDGRILTRCRLPYGELRAARLVEANSDLAESPKSQAGSSAREVVQWQYRDVVCPLADRAILHSSGSQLLLRINGRKLQLSNESGLIRIGLFYDDVAARHHASGQNLSVADLELLRRLVEKGDLEPPDAVESDLRSDFPTCPVALFVQEF